MGHQKKRVPKLEPVLENYMGPPMSYNTPATKPPRHGGSSAKVAPAAPERPSQGRHGGMRSLNPVNVFGKLPDRYVRVMNELSMGGDMASVGGYHGCVRPTEYHPGATEHHRSSAAHEKEIRALREELAARRLKSELAGEKSDDDEDLEVAEHPTIGRTSM